MFDTHCHLSYPALFDNIAGVLQRAAAAGVTRMLTVGTRLADGEKCLALSRQYRHIFSAVGIHPHHAAEAMPEELLRVCSLFTDPLVVAAGEMGLDYHYDFSPRDLQRQFFEQQLQAAVNARKPVILHGRDAIGDCLAILKNFPAVGGVFHCFTGTLPEAREILDAGYYLGFTGVITFKNAQALREIVQFVPADRLIMETDAPYLSPEPMRRQKDNEPALIVHSFRKAAELRKLPLEQLITQTTANALRLFNLPAALV